MPTPHLKCLLKDMLTLKKIVTLEGVTIKIWQKITVSQRIHDVWGHFRPLGAP